MNDAKQRPPEALFDAARDAFEDEWGRLSRLGRALSQLDAAEIEDATARARRQDDNLRAFEDMTAQAGAAALGAMRDLLPRLAARLEAARGGEGATEAMVADLGEAIQSARRARDADMARLIARLRANGAET